MSQFHGPQGKGAMVARRNQKHVEAVERNAAAPVESRTWHKQVTQMTPELRRRILEAEGKPKAVAGRFGISPATVKALRQQAEEAEEENSET